MPKSEAFSIFLYFNKTVTQKLWAIQPHCRSRIEFFSSEGQESWCLFVGRQQAFTLPQLNWASLVAQMVKNPPVGLETWVRSLGWEDPPDEDIATHSSILAWRNPMDRGAWWATVHGSKRVGHGWATKHSTWHNLEYQYWLWHSV